MRIAVLIVDLCFDLNDFKNSVGQDYHFLRIICLGFKCSALPYCLFLLPVLGKKTHTGGKCN